MGYQRVKIVDHSISADRNLEQVVVKGVTFFCFSGLDRGEVGFGHLSELDVWYHDFSRHFID